jgi:hypothetical protein
MADYPGAIRPFWGDRTISQTTPDGALPAETFEHFTIQPSP